MRRSRPCAIGMCLHKIINNTEWLRYYAEGESKLSYGSMIVIDLW